MRAFVGTPVGPSSWVVVAGGLSGVDWPELAADRLAWQTIGCCATARRLPPSVSRRRPRCRCLFLTSSSGHAAARLSEPTRPIEDMRVRSGRRAPRSARPQHSCQERYRTMDVWTSSQERRGLCQEPDIALAASPKSELRHFVSFGLRPFPVFRPFQLLVELPEEKASRCPLALSPARRLALTQVLMEPLSRSLGPSPPDTTTEPTGRPEGLPGKLRQLPQPLTWQKACFTRLRLSRRCWASAQASRQRQWCRAPR